MFRRVHQEYVERASNRRSRDKYFRNTRKRFKAMTIEEKEDLPRNISGKHIRKCLNNTNPCLPGIRQKLERQIGKSWDRTNSFLHTKYRRYIERRILSYFVDENKKHYQTDNPHVEDGILVRADKTERNQPTPTEVLRFFRGTLYCFRANSWYAAIEAGGKLSCCPTSMALTVELALEQAHYNHCFPEKIGWYGGGDGRHDVFFPEGRWLWKQISTEEKKEVLTHGATFTLQNLRRELSREWTKAGYHLEKRKEVEVPTVKEIVRWRVSQGLAPYKGNPKCSTSSPT